MANRQYTTGQLVQRFREAKGWSRYRLAKEAGVQFYYLAQLEECDNSRLSFGTACKLADALDIDVNKLRPTAAATPTGGKPASRKARR